MSIIHLIIIMMHLITLSLPIIHLYHYLIIKLNLLYCFISIIKCLVGTLCSWVIHYCATLVAEIPVGWIFYDWVRTALSYLNSGVGRFVPTLFARIVLDVCWIGDTCQTNTHFVWVCLLLGTSLVAYALLLNRRQFVDTF